MTLQSNILVISDLHLGEDLSLSATAATTRNLEVLEKQLIGFLRYYTGRRHDGMPWRLVINGDMVDFLTVCVLPGERGLVLAADEISADEHIYGLGRRPRVARTKMEAVIERHTSVFRHMAQFMAAGNSIEIIAGNHDTELHFDEVQTAMREGIARIWSESAQGRRDGAVSADVIRERIRFHRWFFYEPGVAWIEHGHQYDECSSYDFALDAVEPGGEAIASNVDAAGLRYVTNRFDEADPHALAEWNFVGYLKFGWSLGLRGLIRLFASYASFVWSMLMVWRRYRPSSKLNRARAASAAARLQALGQRYDLHDELRAVHELRRRPVVGSLRRLMSVLMVDRMLVCAGTALAILVALIALPILWALVTTVGLVAAAGVGNHLLHRRRSVDPEVTLGLMPERILQHIDARFVVFGHTHEPVAQRFGEGKCYFNSGTWVPAGKPGLLRSFTHVVIRATERGVRGQLCQWRDGASRAFTPSRQQSRLEQPITAPVPLVEPAVAKAA